MQEKPPMILRKLIASFVLICLGVLSAYAQTTDNPDAANIDKFVYKALLQGSGDFALSEYTHLQKLRITETDKKGNSKVRLSTVKEAFVPSRMKQGRRVRWVYVLIEKDGKPVSAADIEKERLKAGERLLKAEEELQKQPLTAAEQTRKAELPPPRGIYFSISSDGAFASRTTFSIRSILYFGEFSNPRFEMLNGRSMLLLDFRPAADAQWPDDESYKAQLSGRAWFDVEDVMLAKLEGWPHGQPMPEKPYVVYESLRTPDGQWMPRVIAMNTDQRKDFFKRDIGDVIVEFSDYQRFGTEAKDVKLSNPK
jgi:hypothetical protein